MGGDRPPGKPHKENEIRTPPLNHGVWDTETKTFTLFQKNDCLNHQKKIMGPNWRRVHMTWSYLFQPNERSINFRVRLRCNILIKRCSAFSIFQTAARRFHFLKNSPESVPRCDVYSRFALRKKNVAGTAFVASERNYISFCLKWEKRDQKAPAKTPKAAAAQRFQQWQWYICRHQPMVHSSTPPRIA